MSGQPEGSARLAVLGGLELTDARGRSLDPILTQPRRLGLLLYLAISLPRGFHRRDTLLAMFWPESDHARASGSLRQALYFLRQQLPAGAVVNRGADEIRIDPHVVVCDAVRFDAALDLGREEEALALYRGDLLPEFHLPDAPDFDRWLDLERERLRRRAWRAAAFVARRCHDDGDDRRAGEWARRAAELAPFDEAAQLEAATLLRDAGDRRGAAHLLDETAKRFQQAGIDASAELAALAERIRSGRDTGAAAAPPPASSRASAPPPAPPAAAATATREAAVPSNLDAYHEYLRARHFNRQRTPASMLQALEHYHAALRLCPDFAAAHAGLAEVWCALPVYSPYAPADAYPRAKHHAAKALALDERLAEAHAWFALATICYEWDWTAAEERFQRGLELDPNSSDVRVPYALYLLNPTGRFDQAIQQIEFARQLSPISPAESTYVALVCYHAREFQRAAREARLVVELNENFPLAWWVLGMAHEQLGDVDEAIRCFQRAVSLTGEGPLMLAQLGRGYAVAGDRARAEEILARLTARGDDAGPAPFFTAALCGALGDVEAGMEWLERAYRQRVPHLVFLAVGAEMDTLRKEKRFRELLMRIGLGNR